MALRMLKRLLTRKLLIVITKISLNFLNICPVMYNLDLYPGRNTSEVKKKLFKNAPNL